MAQFENDGPLSVVKAPFADVRLQLDPDPEQWWTALLTLQGSGEGISIDDFTSDLPPEIRQALLIPATYSEENRARRYPRNFVTVIALAQALDALNDAGQFPQVVSVDLGTHVATDHIDFEAGPVPPAPLVTVGPDTVLMGVIDDGIAIGHDLFRSAPSQTRILHADIMAVMPNPAAGNSSYGRVYDKAGIDSLLAQFLHDGLLDEVGFYTATGQVDHASPDFQPISQARSHGTHVTGLAAGYEMGSTGSAGGSCGADRPIICASLPPAVTIDVTGQSLLPSLALALQSVLNAARGYVFADGSAAPMVLNFSYGNTSGPHDGTDETSELLAWYTAAQGDQKLWMVLPAGNSNLAQGHGILPLDASCQPLVLNLLPDDHTASHVECWLPYGFTQDQLAAVTLQVTSPDGVSCALRAEPGARIYLYDSLDRPMGQLALETKPAPTSRSMFALTLFPTASLAGDVPLAPSGRWSITAQVGCDLPADSCLEVWIQRDRSLPGYRPNGRQSYFSDPAYRRFGQYGRPVVVDPVPDPSQIRRSGTLSGFACGPVPAVVAALVGANQEVSAYSASGPITQRGSQPPPREGPDVTCLADDSLVLSGVISAGTRSGSWARMTGTSVSAPRLARYAADHIGSTTDNIRVFLYDTLGRPGEMDPRSGAGIIPQPMPWDR